MSARHGMWLGYCQDRGWGSEPRPRAQTTRFKKVSQETLKILTWKFANYQSESDDWQLKSSCSQNTFKKVYVLKTFISFIIMEIMNAWTDTSFASFSVGISTDGTKAMVGKTVGALVWIQTVEPSCASDHCILHYQRPTVRKKTQFPLRMPLTKQ